MRIEVPHHTERFGAVRIHSVQEVWELDSGSGDAEADSAYRWQTVRNIPYNVINEIHKRMAIVVPCRSERLKVLDGVLSGVPHDCLIILVSNSPRRPSDRYAMECETVDRFCHLVQRGAVMIHQKDGGLAHAFEEAGMPEILDTEGLVADGKGEGMLIGLALAKLAGRDYIGFVDADNYVPGAVHEYIKAYAVGMHLSKSPCTMVRISWRSKPKIQGNRLFFNKWGRSSQVTNEFINLLLSEYSGFGTDIVATGNAGEHAMTMGLAERLRFGSGYSVEPKQFVDLFELFGGIVDSPYPEVMKDGVEVFQVETRNPHFHEDKGGAHVDEMRLQALNVLYHSEVCPELTREEIRQFLREQGHLGDGDPPVEMAYPPLSTLDWEKFRTTLAEKSETLTQAERSIATTVVQQAPIQFGGAQDGAASQPEVTVAGDEDD